MIIDTILLKVLEQTKTEDLADIYNHIADEINSTQYLETEQLTHLKQLMRLVLAEVQKRQSTRSPV